MSSRCGLEDERIEASWYPCLPVCLPGSLPSLAPILEASGECFALDWTSIVSCLDRWILSFLHLYASIFVIRLFVCVCYRVCCFSSLYMDQRMRCKRRLIDKPIELLGLGLGLPCNNGWSWPCSNLPLSKSQDGSWIKRLQVFVFAVLH